MQLEIVASVFGTFQKKSKLNCPSECGNCCFKPDISCTPYELLPLAFHLAENDLAESILEKARSQSSDRCIFLKVVDEEKGHGQCLEYKFRPYVCRVFGVAARKNKYGNADLSICSKLKEMYEHDLDVSSEEVPHIEKWKANLESLDPHLTEKEIPINQALIVILEKVLLVKSFE